MIVALRDPQHKIVLIMSLRKTKQNFCTSYASVAITDPMYRSEGKILLLVPQIAQYEAVAPESNNFTLVLKIAHY